MTHSPDTPFGCSVTWGEPIPNGVGPDGRIHICTGPELHFGAHVCSCGTVADDATQQRTAGAR